MSFVYLTIAMTAMLGFISLGVDLGRVQLAKTQLRSACDAAARYAVTGLADGSYASKALAAAAENVVDGSPLVLQAGDVQCGRWANGTFTAGSTLPNAVKITGKRVAARGTAVPLIFAQLVGRNYCDVNATTVCQIQTLGGGNGFAGLNAATISTTGTVDSYMSSDGAYSSSKSTHGDVATNGTLTLANGVKIQGNGYYRAGYNTSGGSGFIAGGQALYNSTSLSYPNPTLPASYINMGAFNGTGNQTYTMPGGNYYFTSLSVAGNFTVNITGQVNIYVGGPVSISGTLNTPANNPGNLRIMTTTATTVNVNANTLFAADIYAPNSAVTIGGSGNFFGRAIGSSLNISGTMNFHYDESLNSASNAGTITTVY